MAWIRKGLWDLLCSEEPDVAFAFALGLLIPRARPAPLSFPGISFPPREVCCIFWDYREVGYVRRFAFFLLGMVWLDLGLAWFGIRDHYAGNAYGLACGDIMGYVDV
jgi:hypothetical protein